MWAASGVDRLAWYADHVENGEQRLRLLGEGFDLVAQLVEGRGEAELDHAGAPRVVRERVSRLPAGVMGSLDEQLDAAGSGADLLSKFAR